MNSIRRNERKQVIAVDLATCTLKVWGDVTSVYCSHPVTQCHVGRLGRSLSLFAETSYSSRLGGLCTDQVLGHRLQRLTSDIAHQCLIVKMGHVRWAPDTHIRVLVIFEHRYHRLDVGDRQQTSPEEGEIGRLLSKQSYWAT